MQPAKLQWRLSICSVSSEALLFAITSNKPWYFRQIAKLLAELRGYTGTPKALLFALCHKAYFLTTSLIYITNYNNHKNTPRALHTDANAQLLISQLLTVKVNQWSRSYQSIKGQRSCLREHCVQV